VKGRPGFLGATHSETHTVCGGPIPTPPRFNLRFHAFITSSTVAGHIGKISFIGCQSLEDALGWTTAPGRSTMKESMTVTAGCNKTTGTRLGFLDEPFRTWQSTTLFLAFSSALVAVIVFLTQRYLEVLGLTKCDCQRLKSPGMHSLLTDFKTPDALEDGYSEKSGQKRHTSRTTLNRPVAPNAISIRDVREGGIAKRRQESSTRSN